MAGKFNLAEIDRRWLFLLMAAVITVPFLIGIRPDIVPTAMARSFYDEIENLEPGSVVLVSADYDPGSEAEIYPMNLALFRHLARKDVRVVITQLWPQAGPLVEDCLEKEYFKYGKEYGKDVVNLTYKPGGQVVIKKMYQSIREAFPFDEKKTAVAEVPAMEGVEKLDDIDLFIILSAGTPGTKEWVQQCQSRTGKPMISGVTAVSAPDFFAYLNSRQLVGLLGGLRGAADYETLVGYEGGRGVDGMGPQTFGHILIVLFIIAGNVGYVMNRRKERRA